MQDIPQTISARSLLRDKFVRIRHMPKRMALILSERILTGLTQQRPITVRSSNE